MDALLHLLQAGALALQPGEVRVKLFGPGPADVIMVVERLGQLGPKAPQDHLPHRRLPAGSLLLEGHAAGRPEDIAAFPLSDALGREVVGQGGPALRPAAVGPLEVIARPAVPADLLPQGVEGADQGPRLMDGAAPAGQEGAVAVLLLDGGQPEHRQPADRPDVHPAEGPGRHLGGQAQPPRQPPEVVAREDNVLPMAAAVPAAGAAEGAARMAGAEDINFMVFGSGKRTETVIGRATGKIMRDGEMVMAAMAVQYEGYVATVEYPFVIGRASDEQKRFLNILFEAANIQQNYLHPGTVMGEMVKNVKAVFAKYGMTKYDLYPPMHGIGLAEAESPYPDENSTAEFESGMCVNSDISLWGAPEGSNRIEEGFVITADGPQSLTPGIRELIAKGL